MIGFAVALDSRRELRKLEVPCDPARQLAVELPVRVFGPGVETPVRDRNVVAPFDEDGARVARPDAIGGPHVKLHLFEIDIGTCEYFAGSGLLRRITNDDVDLLY